MSTETETSKPQLEVEEIKSLYNKCYETCWNEQVLPAIKKRAENGYTYIWLSDYSTLSLKNIPALKGGFDSTAIAHLKTVAESKGYRVKHDNTHITIYWA